MPPTESNRRTAVFLTTHLWRSKRKAGFHWIADALLQRGWTIVFVTAVIGLVDRLKRDYRAALLDPRGFNRLEQLEERVYSYVWYDALRRPSRLPLPLLNKLTYSFFAGLGRRCPQGLEDMVRQATLLVFESCVGLPAFPAFRRLNPEARCVYRVSDDLAGFGVHQVVRDAERAAAAEFDLISVPYEAMLDKVEFREAKNLVWFPHGIPTRLLDRDYDCPYAASPCKRAVFTGVNLFDEDFPFVAAPLVPEVEFHIIGPQPPERQQERVTFYGEMPYEAMLPYVKHADIALQCLTRGGFGTSNKSMIYTYCGLPIVASSGNGAPWPHVFCYEPGDEASIATAIRAALAFDRAQVPASSIKSWDQVAEHVAGDRW